MSNKPLSVEITVNPFYVGSTVFGTVRWEGCVKTVYTNEIQTMCNLFYSFEKAHEAMIIEKSKLETF
jgi:capsid portal protein